MSDHRLLLPFLGSLLAASALAVGCTEEGPPPTPTKTPNALVAAPSEPPPFSTPTPSLTPTEPPTSTPVFTPTLGPTHTPFAAPTWTPPPPQTGLPPTHYWLQRPIPEGYTNFVDRNYPYGGTAGGQYRVHHGYEFYNPRGTPIIAPAAATVAYAGDDTATQFGPQTHYYGFLVVLQLDAPVSGQPLYLLFAHMDTIEVQEGDRVEAGDVLGTVGNSGVALGAHLHFEVRIGDMYDYNSTRNPDLWIFPFYDFGTLAGRVVDGNGNFLYEVSVTAKDMDGVARYTWSYADDSVNPDDAWGENFTLGDLPVGYYRVYINHPTTGRAIEHIVYVEAGKTVWVEFVVE